MLSNYSILLSHYSFLYINTSNLPFQWNRYMFTKERKNQNKTRNSIYFYLHCTPVEKRFSKRSEELETWLDLYSAQTTFLQRFLAMASLPCNIFFTSNLEIFISHNQPHNFTKCNWVNLWPLSLAETILSCLSICVNKEKVVSQTQSILIKERRGQERSL